MADNAGGRTRTDTSLSSLDFESSASTDFTTPAKASLILAYLSSKNQVKIWRLTKVATLICRETLYVMWKEKQSSYYASIPMVLGLACG